MDRPNLTGSMRVIVALSRSTTTGQQMAIEPQNRSRRVDHRGLRITKGRAGIALNPVRHLFEIPNNLILKVFFRNTSALLAAFSKSRKAGESHSCKTSPAFI